MVTSAAWMRAAWSAFELPVGKLTFTEGLQQKLSANNLAPRGKKDALVDSLARVGVRSELLDVLILARRARARDLDRLAVRAVHRAVAVAGTGWVDAGAEAELWGERVELTEVLEIVQGELEAQEMEENILQRTTDANSQQTRVFQEYLRLTRDCERD